MAERNEERQPREGNQIEMTAFNRAGTEMATGAGVTTGGLTAEAAKHVEKIPPIDIMLIDWIFWTPNVVLNTGGLIAITGSLLVFHGWNRGRKEQKRREERETLKMRPNNDE